MPSRNTVKNFNSESMYHVYNRGVEKRSIFLDDRDYAVFLSYLKYALLTNEKRRALEVIDKAMLTDAQQFNLRRLGLSERLDLVAYCLMPNHFHLLLYQYDAEAITSLMRSVATGYVMYFNNRYKRSGRLFQGTYKAAKIDNDAYWQHISRYIHLNPVDIGVDYRMYDYSSYRYYQDKSSAEWLKADMGMSGMSASEYSRFIEDWLPYREQIHEIKKYLANF